MATLTDLRAKFDYRKVRPAVEKAFDNTEREWVLLNIEQLAEGKRHDGLKTYRLGALYYPYAPLTVALKERQSGLSGVTDRVTLYDTGAYYAGITAERKGGEIVTTSTDSKAAEIEQNYGDVLGLSNPKKAEYIAAVFTPEVKNQLNL